MREKNKEKQAKINQAVLEIVAQQGIAGLSFGKIAKWANVSSGTPYVYYQDKTDMLSQVYLDAKQKLDTGLNQQINQYESAKDQLMAALNYFAHQYLKYPLEANYVLTIHATPELISADARENGAKMKNGLSELACRLCHDYQEFKLDDPTILGAVLLGPIMWLLRQAKIRQNSVTDEQIKQVVAIAVNGLLHQA